MERKKRELKNNNKNNLDELNKKTQLFHFNDLNKETAISFQ